MDVLSEVLKVVKLEGALFFNGEFSAPWCLSSSPSTAMPPHLSAHVGHPIVYHFLTEGRAYVKLPDGRREDLTAGDIVVVPHGDPHLLGNGSAIKPIDSREFAKDLTEGLKRVQFGGGGEVTKFVCGYMVCDPRLSEVVLAGLPKIFKVHVVKEASGQWLEHSIRFTVDEVHRAHAGSEVVLAKLSELLFVETLRRYITALPVEQTGWLAGARDSVVGQVLAFLHKEPAQRWTISNLSRKVGISRTRLGERFHHFLGESPMAYLTKWRLKLGAEILQSTQNSVAAVAAAVGYGSEAAFNRAFKREFDCPPGQFRRKKKDSQEMARD
ncbi:MAG TPA: AraC family transcriptional regulator [Edaphobacter sp.]|jgi:AraC-like DNA-binding protein|nr:AraC family transcriptional regulator [Edaphobacter sp.]